MDEFDMTETETETTAQRRFRTGVWLFVLLWGALAGVYTAIQAVRWMAGH